LRTAFPFNQGSDVFARLVAESTSEIKLSPVFKISPALSNTAPSLTVPVSLSFESGTSLSDIALTLLDQETPSLGCAAALTIRPNNTQILPSSAITISGTAPHCKIALSSAGSQSGSTQLSVYASDGSLTTDATIPLTVLPPNNSPTLALIASPQITPEDTSKAVAFVAGDADGALTCGGSHLLYASSNPALVASSGAVSWSGTWPNCVGTITPVANANGSADITFTLSDGALTASRTFVFTVTAENDAPTLASISNQLIDVGGSLSNLPLTVDDVDNVLSCAPPHLTVTSSDTTFLPLTQITLGGTFPSCTLSIVAPANSYGIANVTVTISDGVLSTARSFFVIIRNPAGWFQEAYIKAANAEASDEFSYNALSFSGETLAVGSSNEDSSQTTITNGTTASSNNGALASGAVYVYRRTVTQWAQEAYIKAANAEYNDRFGYSISLSGDTLAAGAPNEASSQTTITNGATASADNEAVNSGAVYVYRRTGTEWAQEAYIKAVNANRGVGFGNTVSLSGNTLAVGVPYEQSTQTTVTNGTTASTDKDPWGGHGAAYIYRREGSQWAQEAYVKAANSNADDNFGYSISLSGETLAVGAFGEDSNQTTITNGTEASTDNSATFSGAVYVYRRSSARWAPEAYIKAANADATDLFGYPVSLSGDTLAVSAAWGEDSNQTTITNGTEASSDNSATRSGAVYVYRRSGVIWTQEAYIKASNSEAMDGFGETVAISGDTLVAGSWESSDQTTITNGSTSSANNSVTCSGAVFVYRRIGTQWAQEAYVKSPRGVANDCVGAASVALSGDSLAAGSWDSSNQTTITNGPTASSDTSANSSGAVHVFRNLRRLFNPDVFVSSKNQTSISFSLVGKLGTGTHVKVAPAVTGTNPPASSCTGGTVLPTGTTSYTYSGLSPGSKYGFRFCAVEGDNVSEGVALWDDTVSLPPTIGDISAQSTNEDNPLTVNISINDNDSALTCASSLSVTSSNTTVLPLSRISISGSAPACSLVLNPAANRFGTSTISVSVSDRETVVTKSFVVTVNSVFDPAFISDLQSTNNRDSSLVNIPVFIGADNRPDCLLSLSATSDNPALLPQSAISIGGDYPDCTVSLYPPPLDKITGTVTVTLTVNDGSQTVQDTFTVEIFPIWYQEAFIKASNAESRDYFGSKGGQYAWYSPFFGGMMNWNPMGSAVSLSGDSLAAGAPGEDSNQTTITNGSTASLDNDASNSGAVYVYRRAGSEWAPEAYLKAVNAQAGDEFGSSVFISGETLAVAARFEDSNQATITNGSTASSNNSATSSGAVYVYQRTGTQWAQEAYLKAANAEASAEFGSAVSLSDNTLAVGACQEDNIVNTITNGTTATTTFYGHPGSGAVYVYRRVGNQWAQQAYIKAANERSEGYFGASISLSGDTLAVGSSGESANQTTITNGTTASSDYSPHSIGAVYVYRRTGVQWGQEAYVKAANAEVGDKFGTGVALSGDILAVGAIEEDSNQTVISNDSTASTDNNAAAAGAVYIYRRTGTQWAQEAYVKSTNAGPADGFGSRVALSGTTLVVGATGEDSAQTTLTNSSAASSDNTLTDSGAVYVFRRTGSLWAQEAYLKEASAKEFSNFGTQITLSGDTLAVGTFSNDSNQTTITNGSTTSFDNTSQDSGAVYVFRNSRRLFDPDVYVSGRTSTSLTFNWGGNLGSGTTVKVAPAASGTATAAADCTGGTVLPDGTMSYTYSGLNAASKYGFRFCAWDGTNASGGTTLWAETQP
jgi:hypothetical protein